jgi:hypothetical protein
VPVSLAEYVSISSSELGIEKGLESRTTERTPDEFDRVTDR